MRSALATLKTELFFGFLGIFDLSKFGGFGEKLTTLWIELSAHEIWGVTNQPYKIVTSKFRKKNLKLFSKNIFVLLFLLLNNFEK